MKNHKDYSSEFNKAVQFFELEEFEKSIQLVRDMLLESPDNPSLLLSCPGLLINAGNALHDLNSIELGISLIEKLLLEVNQSEVDLIGKLEYNLSNGYSAKAEILDIESEEESYREAIRRQKSYLHNVLLKANFLDSGLLAKAMCNYGNLLSSLGRFIESIDYLYDCLDIDPKHAVAMCNCSSALQKTINISKKHNYRIIYEFWNLMSKASELPARMAELADKEMHYRCLSSLKAIQEYIEGVHHSGIKGLKRDVSNFDSVHSWQPKENLERIKQDRLFLTINPILSNCVEHYKDDLCFESIVTPLTEEGEIFFQKLIKIFNQIKEDFATARYLYYESLYASDKLSETSSITYYVESYDSSDFGLTTGFLKTSFRIAADLLDKCAGFINLYLKLNHPEDKVAFSNIWYEKRNHKNGLHPTVHNLIKENYYLLALKDLNQDLYLGVFPAPIRALRNDATHKCLILSLYGSYQEYEESIDIEHFQAVTRLLLRMTKAAIIYLVGLITLEEKRRAVERDSKGLGDKVAPLTNYTMNYGLSDQLNLDDLLPEE